MASGICFVAGYYYSRIPASFDARCKQPLFLPLPLCIVYAEVFVFVVGSKRVLIGVWLVEGRRDSTHPSLNHRRFVALSPHHRIACMLIYPY